MALTQSLTGRAGQATVRGNLLNITKWTAKVIKDFVDSTDSGNYDPATNQTWGMQAPGPVHLEGTIEGYWDLGGSTDTNMIQIFKTDGPYAVKLSLNRSVDFCQGNFDFTDTEVNVEVPGATMLTFTTSFKSSGVVTLY